MAGPHNGSDFSWEGRMAKEQKRSNREIRKPKKTKEAAAVSPLLAKGMTASIGLPKKKG